MERKILTRTHTTASPFFMPKQVRIPSWSAIATWNKETTTTNHDKPCAKQLKDNTLLQTLMVIVRHRHCSDRLTFCVAFFPSAGSSLIVFWDVTPTCEVKAEAVLLQQYLTEEKKNKTNVTWGKQPKLFSQCSKYKVSRPRNEQHTKQINHRQYLMLPVCNPLGLSGSPSLLSTGCYFRRNKEIIVQIFQVRYLVIKLQGSSVAVHLSHLPFTTCWQIFHTKYKTTIMV